MRFKPSALLDQYTSRLSNLYDKGEAKAIAKIILLEYLGIDAAKLMINDDLTVSDQLDITIKNVIKRLLHHEPIQYLTGKAHFYGRDFLVGPQVLIPRPETEELVHLIVSEYKGKPIHTLDIGTGTGCIPISLVKEIPGLQATAIDISEEALAIAKKNAAMHDAMVVFAQLDILSEEITGTYDLIISNPPYITEREKEQMHQNVLAYEPEIALFVPNQQPLLFYDRIAQLALKTLVAGGWLYFEINEHFGKETKQLLDHYGYGSTEIIQDLSGKDRIVRGQFL